MSWRPVVVGLCAVVTSFAVSVGVSGAESVVSPTVVGGVIEFPALAPGQAFAWISAVPGGGTLQLSGYRMTQAQVQAAVQAGTLPAAALTDATSDPIINQDYTYYGPLDDYEIGDTVTWQFSCTADTASIDIADPGGYADIPWEITQGPSNSATDQANRSNVYMDESMTLSSYGVAAGTLTQEFHFDGSGNAYQATQDSLNGTEVNHHFTYACS
jgi:hypothetical protein